jgi:hypothetical protein
MSLDEQIEIFETNDKLDKQREKLTQAYVKGPAALRSFYAGHGCQRCFWEFMNLEPEQRRDLPRSRKALERYMDPGSRRKDRFYCKQHTHRHFAGVGHKPQTFAGLAGHVCWVYGAPVQSEPGQGYFVGSFGAAVNSPVTPPGDYTDFVNLFTQDPPQILAGIDCTSWKRLPVDDANFEEAELRAMEVGEQWYSLVKNNCMDATFYILDGFGTAEHLPPPSASITPNVFYDQIHARAELLGGEPAPRGARKKTNPRPTAPRRPRK